MSNLCLSKVGNHWLVLRIVCLLPIQCHAIIWTNAGDKIEWNFSIEKTTIFTQEIYIENIICKMVAILSQPQQFFFSFYQLLHFLQKLVPKGISLITHWGRVTHKYISIFLTIIGWDNGLLPGLCKAIIRTNAGILLIGPLGINFSEILIEILTISFKEMCLKVSSANWRRFCLSLNVIISL